MAAKANPFIAAEIADVVTMAGAAQRTTAARFSAGATSTGKLERNKAQVNADGHGPAIIRPGAGNERDARGQGRQGQAQ